MRTKRLAQWQVSTRRFDVELTDGMVRRRQLPRDFADILSSGDMDGVLRLQVGSGINVLYGSAVKRIERVQ